MLKAAFALGAALYVCIPSLASACEGKSFILDETFKSPDSGWDAPDANLTYGPSGASITSDPNASYFTLNRNYTSDGSDICATVVWPAEVDKITEGKGHLSGAIIFWAKDNSNFYIAKVGILGDVSVIRKIAGNWSLVSSKLGNELNLVRSSASNNNEIEVQITGTHASVRVNGKPVLEINGQPPSGSGYVGVYAGVAQQVFPVLISRFQIAIMP